jgi:hypothetical protein
LAVAGHNGRLGLEFGFGGSGGGILGTDVGEREEEESCGSDDLEEGPLHRWTLFALSTTSDNGDLKTIEGEPGCKQRSKMRFIY